MDPGGAWTAARAMALTRLAAEIIDCRRCPRLVEWREAAAADPPARYAGEEYWARPLPGFGDPDARIVVVGLAPAAHGGNRTGRFFTGDRSGDFLFAALHRAGLANQPASLSLDDGLYLDDVFVTAAVRCAPPDNDPLPSERDNCRPFLVRELELLPQARVLVALGRFAWDALRGTLKALDLRQVGPAKFGHGAEAFIGRYRMIGSYHPSQQNTFTGRLTPAMLDDVLVRALELASRPGGAAPTAG
jgi:uracil-DNA glycosylase